MKILKYKDNQGNWVSVPALIGPKGDQGIQGEKGDRGDTVIIASKYSELTFPVAEGTYCLYNDVPYVANQTISTSEAWTAAHWDQVSFEDEIGELKNAIQARGIPDEGTTGQVLRKKSGTDYDVEWASVAQPTDEQVADAVTDWLDDHPEATTTVEDGSITEIKLHEDLAEKVDNIEGITPSTTQRTGQLIQFSDAGDGLPVKDLEVEIVPVQNGVPSSENVVAITGFTECTVTRTGKNMSNVTKGEDIPEKWVKIDGNKYKHDLKNLPTDQNFTLSINLTYAYGNDSTRRLYFTGNSTNKFLSTGQNTGFKLETVKPSSTGDLRIWHNHTPFNNIPDFGKVITKIQLELGSSRTDFEEYKGNAYTIDWTSVAGTVYGGTINFKTGKLTVTYANIASYDGEELPGRWLSSMDVYAEGATPTTGAQVVYELEEPIEYQLEPVEVTTIDGLNILWGTTGNTTVEYYQPIVAVGKINRPKRVNPYGTAGQILQTNGDGSTDWIDKPTPESIAADFLSNGTLGYIIPQMFGAKGDGTTDDTIAIQTAIDYAIQHNVTLFFPAGTYITNGTIYLSHLSASGQGLSMIGAGVGRTIIKESDQRAGSQYGSMFYCYASETGVSSFDFGSYVIKGFTFDENARAKGTPSSSYAWESAHILSFKGGSSTQRFESIIIEQCEFVDKVGCGIAIGPSSINTQLISVRDIVSVNHPTVLAGTIGGKGCIEIAQDSKLTVIERCRILYSQIEREDSESAGRYTFIKISNVNADTLEYTGPDTIFLDVVNTTTNYKFLIRGLSARVSNSVIVPDINYPFLCTKLHFSNCIFLLKYSESTDEQTGDVTWDIKPFYAYDGPSTSDPTYYYFDNCDFGINANQITADNLTGEAIKLNNHVHAYFNHCSFDKHFQRVADIYSYRGIAEFSNCIFKKESSLHYLFIGGAYENFSTRLTLKNCDFSEVADHKILAIKAKNENYIIEVEGEYDVGDWGQELAYGSDPVLPSNYRIKPTLYGSAAPVSGQWFAGDKVVSRDPGTSQCLGWVCTVAGTPGTWKSYGTVET